MASESFIDHRKMTERAFPIEPAHSFSSAAMMKDNHSQHAIFGRQDSRLTDRSAQSTFTEIVGTKRREAIQVKTRPGPQPAGPYGLATRSTKSFAVHQSKYSPFDDLVF